MAATFSGNVVFMVSYPFDVVSKEVNGQQPELALCWVHYEAVLAEAFEEGPQVGQVVRLALASDEDVVQEVDGRQPELALRWVHYEAVLAEAFEDGSAFGTGGPPCTR
ncbi:hypothetical protein AAFF_G00007970 [Aldrovandia affinis]|uniref:Uncharacterized protein n=1 Tax=Aldrovandia affinis TaxID=143900 RepID=A0AAD7T626_9TELE|nr:hypothetical protein AAFF_G00007970 [Aldrovandia affinis]